MLKLKADNWHEGKALINAMPRELYHVYNSPTDIVGERVEIDGTVFWVTDIESSVGSPFIITVKES